MSSHFISLCASLSFHPNDFCRRLPFVLLRKPSDTFDTWKHGNSVIYDEILNEMRYLRVELYIIYD